MLQHHPYTIQPQVCYFYLPPLNGKPAEVIVVLNSASNTIQIPVPEEDLELHAFFQRGVTSDEVKRFGTAQVWRIFDSWAKLELDHRRYKVGSAVLSLLLACKASKPLEEQFAIA